jgi:O-antigen ligase
MTRTNKIYLLAAAFMVVAPLSISGTATEGIKYARLAITVAMVGFGLFVYKPEPFGSSTKAFLFFCSFFTAAALWSNDITWALFNKSMFFMSILGGLYMAFTTKTDQELYKGIKLLAVTGTVAGFFLFLTYLQNPEGNTAGDRMAVGGMNANTIGASAAPMFIFSFFLGLWQTGFKWKALCFSSSILLAIVILGSGSRGAVLMAIVGTLIATKPFLQKKASMVIMSCAIPIALLQLVAVTAGFDIASKIPGLSRITEGGNKENTREGMWKYAYKKYETSPMIGIGWLHFGKSRSSANCHNLYLQVLVETGIVGSAIFLAALVQILLRSRNVKYELYGTDQPELLALPLGLLASIAVHGMVEASALFGTTALPLLLGYSVGLIDRLPALISKGSTPQQPSVSNPAIPRLEIRPSRPTSLTQF